MQDGLWWDGEWTRLFSWTSEVGELCDRLTEVPDELMVEMGKYQKGLELCQCGG